MTYQQLENIQLTYRRKICIFGTGLIGRTWGYDVLIAAGFKVDYYYDNKLSAGMEIRDGIKTIDFSDLRSQKDNLLVFVAVAEKYHHDIQRQLQQSGISNYFMLGYDFLQEICESVIASQNKVVIDRYKLIVDDAAFLKKQFYYKLGYELDLDNPRTFNEKLQWLKIHDRNPEYTKLVDKYEFKNHIEKVLGKEFVIPTLGVWDRVEDIEWDKLPKQFVLKCTHDSGSVIICRDKSSFDVKKASEQLKNAMNRNFYWILREWPYKDVVPRILAEEFLESKEGELTDYKFFAFDGQVKSMFIATDRENKLEETKFDFFDRDFKHLDLINGHPNAYQVPEKPSAYEKMITLTERLTKGIPHVRVDFYEVNGKIYFGEFTFSHWSGVVPFEPYKWDEIWGEWIKLPGQKKENSQ